MYLKKMSTKYLLHLLARTRYYNGILCFDDYAPSTPENTVYASELREELATRPHRPRREERRRKINEIHGRNKRKTVRA